MKIAATAQTYPPHFDTTIIGAGLAGSLCAHLLSETSQTICVIDKSRGSGGRASSKRVSEEISCDLGTPYILTKHPELLAEFKALVSLHVAAPWKQMNKGNIQAFVGTPKMSSITRHWIQNAQFITDTRIHHIERIQQPNETEKKWLLRDDKYQPVVLTKNLIITAPAPQAAAILASHESLAVMLLRANKASSNFQSQWAMWLETEPCDLNAVVEPINSPIARMIKDNDKPLRPNEKHERWVIHASPEWTKEHLDADKKWVTHALLQAFADITEHRVLKQGEPHRWLLSRFPPSQGNNPFFWSAEHHIGLAGDWLCQGDAEGALISALSLIKHISEAQ